MREIGSFLKPAGLVIAMMCAIAAAYILGRAGLHEVTRKRATFTVNAPAYVRSIRIRVGEHRLNGYDLHEKIACDATRNARGEFTCSYRTSESAVGGLLRGFVVDMTTNDEYDVTWPVDCESPDAVRVHIEFRRRRWYAYYAAYAQPQPRDEGYKLDSSRSTYCGTNVGMYDEPQKDRPTSQGWQWKAVASR